MNFKKLLNLIVSSAFLCTLARAKEFEGDCKNLKDIAKECEVDEQGKITYIGMYNDSNIDDKGWEKLFSYNTVKTLHMSGIETNGFNQNIIDKIGQLTNLEELEMGYLSKYDDDINYDSFGNLKKLTKLEIYGPALKKNVINKLENLEVLDIRDAEIDENILEGIKSLKKIEKLRLYDVSFEDNLKYDFSTVKELEVADSELKKDFFASFKNLKKLTMEERVNIEQYHIDEISTLSNLEELNYDIHKTTEGEVNFDSLKNLKNLKICNIALDYNENLNLDSLKNIKDLNLEIVVTSQSDVDKVGALPYLKNAKLLIISSKTDLDLSSLKDHKNLYGLTLKGTSGNYDPLIVLKKNLLKGLNNIKSLTIDLFDLNQNDIDDVAGLTQLEELKIDFSDLDGVDLEPLNKLSNLKSVDIGSIYKGKTLTNSSLEKCLYNVNSELCIAKDMKCLTEEIKSKFKPCSSNTNGKCGKEYGKCPSGQCCSEYGYCGKTDKYCGTGCQSEFGECNSTKVTKDGKCGKDKGKCPAGQCCSKYGYCGKTDDYCGAGCQSEFGDCKSATTNISKDGKCGKDNGKCPTGECCSKYGYCGKTEDYCGAGCQSEFGECKSTRVSKDGKCGKDKGVCPAGECCSKHGYCGKTDKYCGTGCQSEFGNCGTTKVSKDGKCGKDKGVCPSGECCSKYGYCGKTEKYCGSGCQSEFGKCN